MAGMSKAPLHKVLHAFRIWPDKFEEINPNRMGLKWKLDFPIHIPSSRNKVIEEAKGSMQG